MSKEQMIVLAIVLVVAYCLSLIGENKPKHTTPRLSYREDFRAFVEDHLRKANTRRALSVGHEYLRIFKDHYGNTEQGLWDYEALCFLYREAAENIGAECNKYVVNSFGNLEYEAA